MMSSEMDYEINSRIQDGTPFSAEQKVYLARHPKRPGAVDYIQALFTDFFECRGDRLCREDGSILGGIAMFHDIPVTVIAQRKGKNLEENMAANFGMTSPEGYRKALRLMQQAEKFGRPVITFIDTPGAYPGIEAEAHGQGSAIAVNIAKMSALKTPILSIITGEGNSGGALALCVADEIWMLENSVFSVLSPEGFATILWKDAQRKSEACDIMKLTAQDLMGYGLIDGVVSEPPQGAHTEPEAVYSQLDRVIGERLKVLMKQKPSTLLKQRYEKYRSV